LPLKVNGTWNKKHKIIDFKCGDFHSIVLIETGKLYVCGGNMNG